MSIDDDDEWQTWQRDAVPSIEEALHSIMGSNEWVFLHPIMVHPKFADTIWKLVSDTARKLGKEQFESWNECYAEKWKRTCQLN